MMRPFGRTPAPRRGKARPAPFAYTRCDRIMFPDSIVTKGDVLAYYRLVAPLLLPFLKDRPVTVERWPEGVGPGAPHFWQKRTPPGYPKWIRRVTLPAEGVKPVDYPLIDSPEALLYFVNQDALTFHVWLSRLPSLDRPDVVLFDLDPGTAPFDAVVEVAREVRALLAAEGIPAYVKTSGRRGLHVLAPWRGAGQYEAARNWAEGLAEVVAEELPDVATTDVRKPRRGTRVYVDVMQNARGHTMVPPYVLRATPEASVSMPLTWAQVRRGLDPAAFNLRTLPERLALRKKKGLRDPLRGLLAP